MILALRARRRRAGQAGFTLIELLVVLGIIAILAAIVTFGVVGFLNQANTSACKQEKSTVQTALDSDMAKNGTTIIAAGTGVSDWASNPQKDATANQTIETLTGGNYLRSTPTRWGYTYGADGKITAATQVTNGPAVPSGC
ncbi:MAG: type II secretion system protein [Candidatus Dormibacteria bacterium]